MTIKESRTFLFTFGGALLLLLACCSLAYSRLTAQLNHALSAIQPQDYQTIAFFLMVAIFEIWERFRPARRIDRWADLKLDMLSFAFAILLNRLFTRAFGSFFTHAAPAFLGGALHWLQSLPGGVKILCAIVVADFIIYWLHRAQHHWDLLWRTHAWHHSVEYLYWFSGFRTSFLHSLMNNIPQAAVPMLLFGLTPFQAGIGYSIGVLIQFWEHTNIHVNVGPLRWIIITPDYHRVHHSATQHCRMNLGGTFCLWDRMFGTYVDPATVPEHFPLGLGEPVDKKKIPRMLIGI